MKSSACLLTVLVAAAFCAACTANIAPLPTTTAIFNPTDNSLTEIHDGVAITAKIDQLSVQPYQQIDNLTSFHITIDNQTGKPVEISSDAFVLKDGDGQQFRIVTPEHVKEIVSRDTVYLIPYPYIGYYYLEDQEHGAFTQTMASSLPFYAEYHPQDIFTRALPAGPILPHSKVAGVIYFLADPAQTNHVELLLFADTQLQGEPRYRFPFGVAK